MRRMSMMVAVIALAVAPAVMAEEGKVEVNASVVLMSNQGNTVDPALASMKEKFAREHFNFSSYKLLSSDKLGLREKHGSDVKLPNGKKATVTLDRIQKGTALITVNVERLGSTSYQLGREGSVFINVGHMQGGEVFLVLSPVTGGR